MKYSFQIGAVLSGNDACHYLYATIIFGGIVQLQEYSTKLSNCYEMMYIDTEV